MKVEREGVQSTAVNQSGPSEEEFASFLKKAKTDQYFEWQGRRWRGSVGKYEVCTDLSADVWRKPTESEVASLPQGLLEKKGLFGKKDEAS